MARKNGKSAVSRVKWKRVCVVHGCGAFQVSNSRCQIHSAQYEQERGSRQDRGYDAQHERIRARLLKELRANELRGITMLCWRCLESISSDQDLDADHSTVLASEGGVADCLTHSSCNRAKRIPE